ncbi:helix-turn-helix transcriptional regulator [Permianibacter sp. IMCC34836]|uniref:ArsR/SmtB family transcription factor n=1 Tax=Permianibacter fluminis TaxID=2738515 RepID=UPI001555280B|nr:metalloregulator ArsR/SmtB family transcription factor [Permianibacter fluminis]NQD38477.1 helix-turn-helix transcriptional regulator [Permianibacter fluminis]
MDSTLAVRRLAALAQDSRLAIFRALVVAGPTGLVAGQIAEQLALPAATLSFHLKELSQAGLIAGRQQGRFISYSVQVMAMNELLGFLTDNCCGGEPCGLGSPATAGCCPTPEKELARANQQEGMGSV